MAQPLLQQSNRPARPVSPLATRQHRFPLRIGEVVTLNGFPYAYDGGGHLVGATDPAIARSGWSEREAKSRLPCEAHRLGAVVSGAAASAVPECGGEAVPSATCGGF